MQILPNGKCQFIDQNGAPLASGTVGFYAPGTLNPLVTYQDQAGTIPNTNPVALDSRGQAIIWGSGTFRQIVQDANSVTIWDQIVSSSASSGDLAASTGASLVGFSDTTIAGMFLSRVNRVVDSIGALRALSKAVYTRSFVSGYYQPHDGGGGAYQYDPADTASADNGGTIIVATDGGRWKLQLNTSVSAKQFGAKGDNTTDDAAAFNLATTYLGTTGGRLYVPAGTYLIGAPISVPSNVEIHGEFTASILKAKKSLTSIISVTGGAVGLSKLMLDGNNYLAGAGITNAGQNYVTVANCYVQNCGNGFVQTDIGTFSQSPSIHDSYFVNNTTGVYIQGGAINVTIYNNYIYGGNGIFIDISTNHNEGIMVWGNLILPSVINGTLGIGVTINAGLEIQFFNNIIDQCLHNAVVISGASAAASVAFVKFTDNWFGFSVAPNPNGVGVLVQGQVNNIAFRGNTFAVCPTYGLQFQNAAGFIPTNVIVDGSMFQASGTGDIVVNSSGGFYRITDNLFTHPTRAYSENSNSIAGYISGNSFPSVPSISTASKMFHNYGIVSDNSGLATILSGTSTITVSHGLSTTPSFQDITLTPTGISSSDPGEIAVSAVTPTQFVISCRNNPGASNLTIAWKADVNR